MDLDTGYMAGAKSVKKKVNGKEEHKYTDADENPENFSKKFQL